MANGNKINWNDVDWSNLPQQITSTGFFKKIAFKQNVDGNTAGATVLTFVAGNTLTNSVPLFAVFTRNTGTFTIAVCTIRANAAVIMPAIALAGIAATAKNLISYPANLQTIDVVNNLDVNVTTPNGTACTFNVDVYGVDNQ